jgi:glycosyltransferase involved in cell wall biosynthesis
MADSLLTGGMSTSKEYLVRLRATMTKKVFLDVIWKEHSLHHYLVSYPPEGYEFVTGSILSSQFRTLSKVSFTYDLMRFVGRLIPIYLFKSFVDSFVETRPPGTELTYASQHLVFRREPWVVEVELVHALPGGGLWGFKRYKGLIEKVLASSNCQRIITWTETAKKTLLYTLNCASFADKIETVYLARSPVPGFTKEYNHSGKVKLIFVNSSNILGQFDRKGGKEVIETFISLRESYPNLELVLRSDMPSRVKERIQGVPGLKVIEHIIPWEHLEQEFKTADIYLFPSHITPGVSILDAMAYELPVVTIDAYANAELVEDGKTGFVVRRSDSIPYDDFYFNLSKQQEFLRAIKQIDSDVVRRLAEKVSILIENPELRRQMGRAGRWKIEHGKFSIKRRNEQLKRIFDEAIGGQPLG